MDPFQWVPANELRRQTIPVFLSYSLNVSKELTSAAGPVQVHGLYRCAIRTHVSCGDRACAYDVSGDSPQ